MIKLLLYCTKAKPFIYYDSDDKTVWKSHDIDKPNSYHLNGKIVAECECHKVEEIPRLSWGENPYECKHASKEELLNKSYLNVYDLYDYLKGKNGYALHLSNLKIFDRTYNLNEWFNEEEKELTKAPQNMCYCYHWLGDKYILISIQPKHLALLLHSEKPIEVRREILNCLKELI